MAGAASLKSNPPRGGSRKRVEAETVSLKRARDGSAFTRCEACNKDVAVGLIDMHNCSLDSKIRMNLESQVTEITTEVKKPERKRTASSDHKEKKNKREKKSTDPNKLKRPPTAFFLFMDDFRKEFKVTHPDSKKASAVAKEGGERWKSMTEEEKKPYIDRAQELKEEYKEATEKSNAENEEENDASEKEDCSVLQENDASGKEEGPVLEENDASEKEEGPVLQEIDASEKEEKE